jgi:hypothetical protein
VSTTPARLGGPESPSRPGGNPWLADVDVLPYTLIYRAGEKVAEFAGGGIGRLESRLERVRSEAG